jgi:hypothetical protein
MLLRRQQQREASFIRQKVEIFPTAKSKEFRAN